VGAFFAVRAAVSSCDKGPSISWKPVLMDGHRAGAQPITMDNVDTALGVFGDDGYTSPAGVHYADDELVPQVAQVILEVQPQMTELKQVVGHSAAMYTDGRDNPDLPLANFTIDAVNYLAYAKVKGEGLTKLLEQLAGQPAFQAVSGVKCVVKNHKLESALIGGKPIDPKKVYNVATIDFLLDGGDQIAVGAVADKVVLSHELVKDIMIKHIKNLEAKGQLIECKSDGRVIMTEE